MPAAPGRRGRPTCPREAPGRLAPAGVTGVVPGRWPALRRGGPVREDLDLGQWWARISL